MLGRTQLVWHCGTRYQATAAKLTAYCVTSLASGTPMSSGNATKTKRRPTRPIAQWTSTGKSQQLTALTGDVHRPTHLLQAYGIFSVRIMEKRDGIRRRSMWPGAEALFAERRVVRLFNLYNCFTIRVVWTSCRLDDYLICAVTRASMKHASLSTIPFILREYWRRPYDGWPTWYRWQPRAATMVGALYSRPGDEVHDRRRSIRQYQKGHCSRTLIPGVLKYALSIDSPTSC